MTTNGPLHGVRVLELDCIGPGPFAAMVLADLGANVLRISRPVGGRRHNPVIDRGRAGQIVVDLKDPAGRAQVLALVEQADVLVEGHRPGVMERLGLGPAECLKRNPRLVYGRVTGWGRSGPLSRSAGHDINYIALSGALYACGTGESGPIPPLNLVGDFGGGGLLLALGIASALFETRGSRQGQVVDAAMTDGAAMLMSMIYGLRATDRWPASRAGNVLDGSAWYYTCYRCADGGWMAVGAIEIEFRKLFLQKLGFGDEVDAIVQTADCDAEMRARIASRFVGESRAHWASIFEGTDACVTAVLSMDEVADHPQNLACGTFERIGGAVHHHPAPRFSRTPTQLKSDPVCNRLLAEWNLPGPVPEAEIASVE